MSDEKQKPVKKQDIKWAAVLWYIHLHVLGVYAIWLMITSAKWMTVLFTLFITSIGCLGVTAGAHRLWAHRSYEASGLLRLFLTLAHTLAGVGPIYDWVLYHRLHHKYYGTDKDPYNHTKGFLYSHYMGNFQSPKVDYEQAKIDIDMRDIENDGYVWAQKKLYWLIFGIFGLLLPLNAPLEYWDETMGLTVMITGILRFAITVNVSWLVNSAYHIWNVHGNKIPPDSISVFLVRKSKSLAYHYMILKSGEFGTYDSGCSTFFIKMWYELGLVNNLITTTSNDIRDVLHQVARKKITMDGALNKLKEMSEYNMKKNRLVVQ
ncbi:PREDICTED: acyl-CoA Delta(11) desaturase [Dufourea novaeangliae]|uniref:acyl-CoA Delta(11) desaturase n=1 Tax=Dufourea novaeangliae TaxID=178035 RepID=UPI000767A032|nr:PREDICTED: acyl-CoA Delta(11) desaturase [Dufourea novaeangliae]